MSDLPGDLPELCCICGKTATEDYDDRDDAPYCGAFMCGYRIQQAIDEAGNR